MEEAQSSLKIEIGSCSDHLKIEEKGDRIGFTCKVPIHILHLISQVPPLGKRELYFDIAKEDLKPFMKEQVKTTSLSDEQNQIIKALVDVHYDNQVQNYIKGEPIGRLYDFPESFYSRLGHCVFQEFTFSSNKWESLSLEEKQSFIISAWSNRATYVENQKLKQQNKK
jgi:hypothetical protein